MMKYSPLLYMAYWKGIHQVASMLADSNGTYWVRRAIAAVTRHRFITIDDQETYYKQKYLFTVLLTATDSIVSEPSSSWVKAVMEANLVDEQHDARATLMDAVKRGFSLENIRSICGATSYNLANRHLKQGGSKRSH